MRARLLEILACPYCRSWLEADVKSREGDEIVSGRLRCEKCPREFLIRGGIPRFVQGAEYASTFSFEWKRWRRTQFDTASRKSSEATFAASTGWRVEDLRGRLVLDAGCGAGRYMDLAARAGAEVVGVDLSLAIDVARENLGHFPNCQFVQADLMRPPFVTSAFDFIYSLGVLHHTPSTRQAFLRTAELLRPGGEAAVWVYPRHRLADVFRYFPKNVNAVLAHDVNYRLPGRLQGVVRPFARLLDLVMETSSSLERAVTRRLPPQWLYALCHAAIPLYYLYRIPLFYPLRLVTKIAMDPDPEWRVLDTFDWYSPRYQWKHTYPEVGKWFEQAGLGEITLLARPVAVKGKRPGP